MRCCVDPNDDVDSYLSNRLTAKVITHLIKFAVQYGDGRQIGISDYERPTAKQFRQYFILRINKKPLQTPKILYFGRFHEVETFHFC